MDWEIRIFRKDEDFQTHLEGEISVCELLLAAKGLEMMAENAINKKNLAKEAD